MCTHFPTHSPTLDTEVCIIGAGAVGLCTATLLSHDGVHCVLLDRLGLAAGATTNNAGVLHSGARYAVADPVMAAECWQASSRMAAFAPHCVNNDASAYYLVTDPRSADYSARLLRS